MQLIILSPDLLLVSVVVAEAADVVGGDVMDCAQHVLSILDLEITNQMPVSRSRDPALTNQRPVIRFWLRQELKKSQCSFVRPVLVCLKLSIFILEQSGSVYGQS